MPFRYHDVVDSLSSEAGSNMNRYIISDHQVANPRLCATLLDSQEFLDNIESKSVNPQDAFWVDVNAFSDDALGSIAAAGLDKLSFFCDRPVAHDKSAYPAVCWSPEKLQTPASGTDLQEAVANALEGVTITSSNAPSFIMKFLFGPSWLMPALIVIGLIAAFYCTVGYWSLQYFNIADMNTALAFIDARDVMAVISIVCFMLILVLLIAREVRDTIRRFKNATAGWLEKAIPIIACVTLVALFIWIASLLFCAFLGGFSSNGPALAVAGNPLLAYFVAVGNYTKYLFVILPLRFATGILMPIILLIAIIGFLLFLRYGDFPSASTSSEYLTISVSSGHGTVVETSVRMPSGLTIQQRNNFIRQEVSKVAQKF